MKGGDMMWNCEWEYKNQAYLKERYEEKMSGKLPYHPVRKIICKGCGREFYTNIETKKYCLYGLAAFRADRHRHLVVRTAYTVGRCLLLQRL